MNRIGPVVTAAALAVACAQMAYAQRVVEPAVPRALQSGESVPGRQLDAPPPAGGMSAPAPAGGGIAASPPQLQQNVRRHARDADARHCLQRATNKDVHRCAQPFLHGGARVTKAAAKKETSKRSGKAPAEKPAPVVAEPPKPPEAMKPSTAKPEDKAKAAEIVKPMDVTKPSATGTAPAPKPDAKAPAPAAGAPAKAAEPTKK